MGEIPKSRFEWAAKFQPTADEQRVIDAAAKDEIASFENNATIRGQLIRILLLGLRDDWPVAPAGVRIAGPPVKDDEEPHVLINGSIDLAYARAADGGPLPLLELRRCRLDAALVLTGCSIGEINLEGSKTKALWAGKIHTVRHVWLNAAQIDDGAHFKGAVIGGEFSANRAKFQNENSLALRLDGAKIDGGVFLRNVECNGESDCSTLTTSGQFSATGAKFNNPGGNALRLDKAKIYGGVFLLDAECSGETDCSGISTSGQFSTNHAIFLNEAGNALRLDRAEIDGGVFLIKTQCRGMTDCSGMKTGGQFSTTGGKFFNEPSIALRLDRAVIDGGVFLLDTDVYGQADCSGLETQGQFSINRAKFFNENGNALRLDNAEVAGGVFAPGIEVKGFIDAKRGRFSSILLSGARLDCGQSEIAIDLEGSIVEKNLELGFSYVNGESCEPARIRGSVYLDHARIGGQLRLTGASFAPALENGKCLTLRRARIEGELESLGFSSLPEVIFDLTGAEIAAIHDDPETGWPAAGRLILDNLTYGAISARAASDGESEKDLAKTRIAWLRRQYAPANAGRLRERFHRLIPWLRWRAGLGTPPRGKFSPQPFEQMEKALRAAGHDYAATRIAVERREWHRRCVDRGLDQFLNGVLKWTSDYGYSPFRAALWYALWVALGAWRIRERLTDNGFEIADEGMSTHGDLHLEPVAYAIDLTIPIVDFGQASAFRPVPGCAEFFGSQLFCQWRDLAEVGYSLVGFTFFSILVLTLTGVIRSDAE